MTINGFILNGNGQKLQKKSFLGLEVGTNRPEVARNGAQRDKRRSKKWAKLRYIGNFDATLTTPITMRLEAFCYISLYPPCPWALQLPMQIG